MKSTWCRGLTAALVAIVGAGCTADLVTQPDPAPVVVAREDLDSTATGVEKVTICHIPPGNPDNRHTITVGSPAVPAHLAHGDYLGECVIQCVMGSPSDHLGLESCSIGR